MTDAKALFRRYAKEIQDDTGWGKIGITEPDAIVLFSACIIAEAITNAKEEIVASIKEVQ